MLFLLLACSAPEDLPMMARASSSGGGAFTHVELLSPPDGATVANPVTFTVSHMGVSGLEISADGWSLGSPWDTGQLTYEFTGVDVPRVITLKGVDGTGQVIASDAITIIATNGAVEEDEGSSSSPGYASVEILSPADGATVANPVTFSVNHEGVSGLEISADGWSLGSPWDTGQLTYEFTGVGVPRVITLEGVDGTGQVIASDTITLTVTNGSSGGDSGASGPTGVPYYYQYDNAYEPGSTCGLTSAAMLLGARGRTRTPDALYLAYGKSQAQSPEGLAQLYRWEGLSADSGRHATRSELRALLDAGDPVVVHGFWTSAGHIVVLVGYDSTGWIVHDPAGDWYLGYGSGSGEAVQYPFGSAWDDDLSWDGDIWWSTAW